MHVKYLISNLLDLSKSASFVLVVFFCFANTCQSIAHESRAEIAFLCDGPPTSNTGSIGSGTSK